MDRNLIFDVGMHDGADSAFYLAKGFDVVAIEANPALLAAARERFAQEIAAGRLRLIDAAIAETTGRTHMAVSDSVDAWSSLSKDFIARSEAIGVKYRYVEVATVSFPELLATAGVPYYLKVDIEGLDMLVIRGLRSSPDRPAYISIESNVSANHAPFGLVLEELTELSRLGYRSFQYVNQRLSPKIRMPYPAREGTYVDVRFSGHESGSFGRELGGRWLSMPQALGWAQVLRIRQNLGGLGGRWRGTTPGWGYSEARRRLLKREHSWYDLHARLGGPPDAR